MASVTIVSAAAHFVYAVIDPGFREFFSDRHPRLGEGLDWVRPGANVMTTILFHF
jgi:hypothetical protein